MEAAVLPDPYTFVRAITLGLGAIWTLGSCLRVWRFARRWTATLAEFGLSERWMRRQLFRFTLRATIFDPINLSLMLTLIGLWAARSVLT